MRIIQKQIFTRARNYFSVSAAETHEYSFRVEIGCKRSKFKICYFKTQIDSYENIEEFWFRGVRSASEDRTKTLYFSHMLTLKSPPEFFVSTCTKCPWLKKFFLRTCTSILTWHNLDFLVSKQKENSIYTKAFSTQKLITWFVHRKITNKIMRHET